MVPFGLSMAATVRVGHAVGRREVAATRRAGMTAIGLGAIFMAAMTLLIVATREFIPLFFLGFVTDGADPTLRLAALLLVVGSTFFIADGVQTVTAGALRGLNDTRSPLLFAAICFWAIGFTACWLLGFTLHYGAVGIWVGLSIGLALYALLLIWRFHTLTNRGYLPDIATPG
jgi:MATE family multidrug resistance protein